jgi:hypothetical protein
VLVAADRLAGDSVEVRQAVDPAAHEDLVDCRGGEADLGGDLDRTQTLL